MFNDNNTNHSANSFFTATPSTLTISQDGIKIGKFLEVNNFYEVQTIPKIEKVIFQNEHTIIIWNNKERTDVKCSEEKFDKEKGLAMAIARKIMDRNAFKKLIDNAIIQNK